MSPGGVVVVATVECVKLAAQWKARIALLACAVAPFVFAVAMRIQSTLPEDTLFGRATRESGFAVSLVVLGFAGLWVIPALTSVVAGDLFSAEDRYGTWTVILTRSRTRDEVFAGKSLVAIGYAAAAAIVLGASSVVAGVLVIGAAPLVSLSGVVLEPSQALTRTALAWTAMLPPAFGLTATAIAVSAVSRSGAAGIGIPVVAALTMQLLALVDAPAAIHLLLITSAFNGWHGLFAEPRFYGPLVRGLLVSGAYALVCLAIAYRTLSRRDIA